MAFMAKKGLEVVIACLSLQKVVIERLILLDDSAAYEQKLVTLSPHVLL